ncbi:MAG TPA: VacJ family lipoprotein [Candidatus Binatia bacterium]|jgi:phospholipid-binding lipoprotein MlaA
MMWMSKRHAGAPKRRLSAVLTLVLMAIACTGARADDSAPDPLVKVNRGIFRFNDALDRHVLEPVARGYVRAVPDIARRGISNFFSNLWFPVTFVNCVLQAKPQAATQSLARFIINTTAGVGGFGDPATLVKVPSPDEDFGQTLGYWGVHPGPFLMLPLLGPSDVRDTFGRIADSVTPVWPFFVPWYATSSSSGLNVVNTRAKYIDNVKALRESSVDYYAAVRNAYLQRRQALVEDRVGTSEQKMTTQSEEDLYYPAGGTEQNEK